MVQGFHSPYTVTLRSRVSPARSECVIPVVSLTTYCYTGVWGVPSGIRGAELHE